MNELLIALSSCIITGMFGIIKSVINTNKAIKQIEKKLDEHNGYAQKFASCDANIKIIQTDIKWIKEGMKGLKNER